MDQDVIGHLIDVERLAYDLLMDAQTESDRRKAAAKEEAERDFRVAYERIIADLESAKERGRASCDKARERDYAEFDAHLASVPQNRTAFNDYLDSLYAGS